MDIDIKSFTGKAAEPYLHDLAKLRIEVFRDFPYLYDGDLAYEQNYLQTYLNTPSSVLIIAFDGETVVGASTALPMTAETPNVQQPFVERDYDLKKVFYFGESVLRKAYRGRGIGVEFFKRREAHARALGDFTRLTFCAVVRPMDHPYRPQDYTPLDDFWRKRGFEPTDMYCQMQWQDLDDTEETTKLLRFWLKPL
jgi:GNAT superfamily N-acetyltransferase